MNSERKLKTEILPEKTASAGEVSDRTVVLSDKIVTDASASAKSSTPAPEKTIVLEDKKNSTAILLDQAETCTSTNSISERLMKSANNLFQFLRPSTTSNGIERLIRAEAQKEADDDAETLKWNRNSMKSVLPELDDYFEFRDSIGEGGFGSIHKALDKRLMRIVAIKTLLPDQMSRHSSRSAFLTEAKVTAYLDHPSIVPIFGIYTDRLKRLHLVMKLLKGKTLKERQLKIQELYKSLPKREIFASEKKLLFERLDIFLKTCDAIAYAHHKRVLHRDLKPENIMIGDFNDVYIMDWGIAEHSDVNTLARISGQIPGTLQYLAPEILLRQPYDSRADLYALGVILYEIVFLRSAFTGTSEEMTEKIVNGDCSPMRHAYDFRISRVLIKIIRKAMQPTPGQRYQNVKLMADDIRKFIRNETISLNDSPFRFLYALFQR